MEVTLFAEKIISIGQIPITNTLLTSWLVIATLVILAFLIGKQITAIPNKAQSIAEIIIESILGLLEGLSDRHRAKRFFPIVITFFLFILTANYIGLLPGFGTIGFREVHNGKEAFIPLFRSINSDLNITLALSIISAATTHYFSVSIIGIKNYLRRYFSLNPINLFVGLLEIIAELTKVLSLSFRLFGNIYAGEALLLTISSLFAFAAPIPFMLLETMVGFVQAAIFMMLTSVFMIVLTEKHTTH